MTQEALDSRLKGLLVCPRCRGELEEHPGWLHCTSEGLFWPIVGGVPHLSPEYTQQAPEQDDGRP